MTRMTGLTVGPPTRTSSSAARSGPPSIGSPDPRKMRPRMFGEKTTSSGLPTNRTVASVDSPLPPVKRLRRQQPGRDADHHKGNHGDADQHRAEAVEQRDQ